jgi:hypothetical protein
MKGNSEYYYTSGPGEDANRSGERTERSPNDLNNRLDQYTRKFLNSTSKKNNANKTEQPTCKKIKNLKASKDKPENKTTKLVKGFKTPILKIDDSPMTLGRRMP